MGNNQKQPLYSYLPIDEFTYEDGQVIQYIWIDKKMKTKENTSYLNAFKDGREIRGYDDFEDLKKNIRIEGNMGKQVRVICSASLDEEVYKLVQNDDVVERAMLFCANKTKASILMRNYPKIKASCFGCPEVLNKMSQWEREVTTSIYFCGEQDISKLHKTWTNWHALTDIDETMTPNMKEMFWQFWKRIVKMGEEKFQGGLMRHVMTAGKGCMLTVVNRVLRSTVSPSKLAYIRWPVYELYLNIKKCYLGMSGKTKVKSCFAVLAFNQSEDRRLQTGKFMSINQFILSTVKKPEEKPNNGEVIVEIKVEECGEWANGYSIEGEKVLFNLGNFFRVLSYDRQKHYLTLIFVAPSKTYKIREGDEQSGIILTQVQFDKMNIHKQGQLYGLMINRDVEVADKYIQRMNMFKEKDLEPKKNGGWAAERVKMNYLLGGSLQNSFAEVENLLNSHWFREEDEVKIVAVVLEMCLLQNKRKAVLGSFPGINRLLTKLKEKKDDKYTLLLKNGCQWLSQKDLYQKYIKQVEKSQNQMLNDSTNMVSDWYFLTMMIKVRCLEYMGNFKGEMVALESLLWILGWTEGREGKRFKKMNEEKKVNYERLNKSEAEKDEELRQKMLKPKVPIEELMKRNDLLNLDFSGLVLNLYDPTE